MNRERRHCHTETMVDFISTVADPGLGPEAAWVLQNKPEGAALRWHVVDSGGARSLCGLDIRYGSRRRPWIDAPETQRCQLCLNLFQSTSMTA